MRLNENYVDGIMPSLLELTYYRGRVGLFAILKALGVGQGNQVAVQAYTCLAVPEAVMATGARPLYVDIERNGFCLDPDDLEKKLTSDTKAIVVQHTFGIPANMAKIGELSKRKGIPIIEDCCHTFASTYEQRQVGTFGIGSFYSFEWGKTIIVGIGGSLIVHEPELKAKIKMHFDTLRYPSLLSTLQIQLQYLGFTLIYRPQLYWFVRSTFRLLSALNVTEGNFNPIEEKISKDFSLRMSRPLQRRLQRKILAWRDHVRSSEQAVDKYMKGIANPLIRHPIVQESMEVVFARYPLIVEGKHQILQRARAQRVELADWYVTPIHPLRPSEWSKVGYVSGSCPNAEKAAMCVVHLPTHHRLTTRDVDRSIDFLNGFTL